MKLEKYNKEAEIIGKTKNNDFSIDKKESARVMNYLIDLYMDPVGSVVREITSNCIDAHRERDLKIAGEIELEEDDVLENFETRNTVLVKYTPQNSILGIGACISFKDWGVGLSEKRVKHVYTKLGASTKRDANDQIGGFGIGCKSPFAYTSTFYITATHNNVKRYYMLSRNNEFPAMDLVFEEECDEKNSTEIIIPLKGDKDKSDFLQAINNQLTFFDSVIYENIEEFGSIDKPVILEETDDYIMTEGGGPIKALIGNVVYPLLTNKISIPHGRSRFPVYFKFAIGEIDIVPSREGIQYNEETVEKINKKLLSVYNQFKVECIDEISKIDDFIEFLTVSREVKSGYSMYSHTNYTNIKSIKACMGNVNSSGLYFKNWRPFEEGINKFFNGLSIVRKSLVRGRKSNKETLSERRCSFNDIVDHEIFYVEDKCSRLKDMSMVDEVGDWIKISKSDFSDKYPIDVERRDEIWDLIVESSETKDYDSYDIALSDTHKESSMSPEELRRLNKEVFAKYMAVNYEGALAWKMGSYRIEDLETTGDIVLYGFPEDDELMNLAGQIFWDSNYTDSTSSYNLNRTFNGVRILKISKSNEKYYMKNTYIQDFFTIDRFVNSINNNADSMLFYFANYSTYHL
jgi:hypothetical protein